MSLEILAAMVVAGLAIAIGAVYLAGLSKPARLADAGQAKSRFALDYPCETAADCRLTAARDAAFLRLESGRIGIVAAFGAKFVTRLIEPPQMRIGERSDELDLEMGDFTFPHPRMRFAKANDAALVASWVKVDAR